MDHFYIGTELVGFHNMTAVREKLMRSLDQYKRTLASLLAEKESLRRLLSECEEECSTSKDQLDHYGYIHGDIQNARLEIARLGQDLRKVDLIEERFLTAPLDDIFNMLSVADKS